MTVNARGLKNKLKRKCMFTYFKEKRIDIVCIQESHITERDVHVWERQWGGKIIHNEGTERRKGEIILVSKFFKGEVQLLEKEDRILIASVRAEDVNFILINIYAPNDKADKIQFLQRVENKIKIDYAEEQVILMGDFNTVMNNELDIISGQPHSLEEVNALRRTVNNLALTDVWRALHDTEKAFTWCRHNPFIARRLDYIFTSEDMLELSVNCEVQTVPNTDHKAVSLEISDSNFERGPGYWRFNNSYLNDETFTCQMKEILTQTAEELDAVPDASSLDKWEICKIKIRDYCTDYGKFKAYDKKNRHLDLQIRLNALEKKIIVNPNDEGVQKEILNVKNQLEILAMEKARGAQIRSRIKWIEDGEKNTKYFLGLEKTRGNKNTMTSIRKDNGTVETDQSNILREQYQYFSKVYNQTPKREDVKYAANQFMKDEHFPKLDENDAKTCEGAITLEEANIALKSMKNGSSPGSDGITIEFIKYFWNNVKSLITQSYNISFENGELSYTQRQGIITLIHKGKDLPRDQLDNWRPITLLNSDYKILAKILTLRITEVISKLINTDQVGYLKNRNISTIIRTIDDTIDYLNNANRSGYLLALDYQKAFDSISKDFLLESFNMFGFGEQFKQWVKILNNNVFSCISQGGWLTQSFPVKCGIRQGCPFSPLAFILAAEFLAIKIRNSQVKGIDLPSKNQDNLSLKIKQMADDTTLFLKDKKDMLIAANIIQDFSDFSNLNLNHVKSKAMQIGRRLIEDNLPFKIVDKIKILGIYFQNNIRAQNITENWEGKIDKMIKLIRSWSQRDLSIHGKITVIKSLLISQFTYIMQSVGLPEHILKKINTVLYKFVWQRKYTNKKAFEKVKRKIMEGNIDEGGLKMINIFDIQKSFYLQWMGKLSIATEENWALIPRSYFETIASDNNIFDVNCRAIELQGSKHLQNEFWRKALQAYLDNKKIDTLEIINKEMYRHQLLWNNCLVKHKHNTLFFPKWKEFKIEYMKDLVNDHENRLLTLAEIQDIVKQNRAITFFEYYALMNAIPTTWKKWVTQGVTNFEQSVTNCKANIFSTKSKNIIQLLKDNSKRKQPLKPCVCAFWQRKLGFEVNNKVWTRPSLATKEIRLKELQWKILHNIYPTNILLSKMRIVDDNKCSICGIEVDFIEHFFYNCIPVRQFWEKVQHYISGLTGITTTLTLHDVLFGLQNEHSNIFNRINEIILIGKMCISIAKKTKSSTPIFVIFENQLSIRKI